MNMYLDLNLVTFQYSDGFGCHHFCLNRFGLELIIFLNFIATFDSVLGLQITVGLQVNSGLQPPTCWEQFIADTMLRHPEPTKERVEPTTLSIIAIEIRH